MLLGPLPKVIELECPQAAWGVVGFKSSQDGCSGRGRVRTVPIHPAALNAFLLPFFWNYLPLPYPISLHSFVVIYSIWLHSNELVDDSNIQKVLIEGQLYALPCLSRAGDSLDRGRRRLCSWS